MKRFIKSAIACVAAVAMVATVAPVTYAAEKAVTVKTQKEFDKAVKAGKTNIIVKASKAIKISTTKAVKITISSKSKNVAVEINAKNASVTNNASVKSITIKGAKSFTENGEFNDIKIATTQKMTLNVSKKSAGADITIAKAKANVTVKADGNVGAVNVASKDVAVTLKGKSTDKILVTAKADNAKITSSVPAKINVKAGADGATVTAKADVELNVAKNATLDKVSVAAAGAAVDLNAKGTVAEVEVAKAAEGATLDINASGKVASVTVNAKADVAVAGSTNYAVKVTVNAADTTVKAETKVETTLNADAKVDLAAGAEGSSVSKAEGVESVVNNGTSDKITVTDSTGKETIVESGKNESEAEKEPEKKPTTPSTGNTNTGVITPPAYNSYSFTTPSAIVITGSGISVSGTDADGKVTNGTITVRLTGTEIVVTRTYDQLVDLVKRACDAVNGKASETLKTNNTEVTIVNNTTNSPLQISATYAHNTVDATVAIDKDKKEVKVTVTKVTKVTEK